MGAVMTGACLGVFAAFSILGIYSSLVPTFLHDLLGVHNFALIGGGSFLIFIIAAGSQALSARMPARLTVGIGVPLLLVCLGTLDGALFAKALWLFLISAVSGGVAVGFIFRGGLAELNRVAQPQHRASVISTFFVAAYVGLGLPAVLIGLIAQSIGVIDASAYVCGLAATIVLVAFIVVLRNFDAAPAPTPPCEPCDSWCHPEHEKTALERSR